MEPKDAKKKQIMKYTAGSDHLFCPFSLGIWQMSPWRNKRWRYVRRQFMWVQKQLEGQYQDTFEQEETHHAEVQGANIEFHYSNVIFSC